MPIEEKIRQLAQKYAQELARKIDARMMEMQADDKSHFLIYQVLGIGAEEGELIDNYQNKGRFLYKYAGAFLEEAAMLCFKESFPEAARFRVENTMGRRPKQFEIDCLLKPMPSKLNGATPRQTAIISPKNTLEFRSSSNTDSSLFG